MYEELIDQGREEGQGVSRRQFLKVAGLTAVAATATGAGAAVIAQRTAVPAPVLTVPEPVVLPDLSVNQSVPELLAQLATAESEIRRLRTSLDATQTQLAAYDEAGVENGRLHTELDLANARVATLVGLLALYEQLDEVDMSSVWQDGLTAVSNSLADLIADTPWLSEGIAAGRQALLDVEAHIPLLQNGRYWLIAQRDKLRGYYEGVKTLLETAVSAAGSFLEMLNSWFQDILKWLPFGLGERASEIMQSLADLLGEVPHTISGLDTNIAQPLAAWLDSDSTETPLQQNLINPLRADVLDKAEQIVSKTKVVEGVYQEGLVQRVETAVASRNLIRTLIADYREQNQISL